MAEDQKRPEGLISFEAGKAIEIGGLEAPEIRKLRPWRPKMPLKELVEKSDDPRLRIYKRLLKAWPNISNARFSEIVREVDRDRLEKILYLHEKTGRLFEEFLKPNITYEEIQILDSVYRYFHLYELAEKRRFFEKLKKAEGLKHRIVIDGRKYEARLYAILDEQIISLDYYENKWGKPEIGIPYREWPCLRDVKMKLEKKAREIAEHILEVDSSEVEQLKMMAERIRDLERDFLRLDIKTFIQFPPRYAVKRGIFKGHLFINKVDLPCSLCHGKHTLWLLAEVK